MIDATVIGGPKALQGIPDGVEICWAKCKHRLPATAGLKSKNDRDFTGLTVMVTLAPSTNDRVVIRSLEHALTFATCRAIDLQGEGWSARFRRRFAGMKVDCVTAAVYVGAEVEVSVAAIHAAVDTLHETFGAALTVLVVVTASAGRLAAVPGVTGFISGAEATDSETARSAFLTLAMLMAPRTLNCIDVEGLSMVLGPTPTVMVQALWMHKAGGLVYLSEADELAVVQADRVLAVPFIPRMKLKEIRALHNQLHATAASAHEYVIFAAVDPLQPGVVPRSAGVVVLLCVSGLSSA